MTELVHRERNFGLDLARAIAILGVFFAHGVTSLGTLGVGVDLFFVLSGFLIGRIYFRAKMDKTFSLWRFWQMRWCRTLPPYYAALLLFALASRRFPGNTIHWYYLPFLQNYVGVDGFGPSWSLCVEEHFYLLLPLLGAIAEAVFGMASFIWILPVASLVPLSLRFIFLYSRRGLPQNWFWMTHFHCEGLTLGVLLAFLFVYHRKVWDRLRPCAVALALIPLVLLVVINIHRISDMRFNAAINILWALGFAGFVRLVYDIRWQPSSAPLHLLKRGVQGLALCSYSVYLVHVLFFTDVRQLLDGIHHGPLKSGVILAAAMVAGVLFYFLVEKPSIDLRDRYIKRDKDTASKLRTIEQPG